MFVRVVAALIVACALNAKAQVPPVTAHTLLECSISQLSARCYVDVAAERIYVVGRFQDTLRCQDRVVVSHGGIDGFVAAFTPSLKLVWIEQFGGEARDEVTAGCVVPGDGLVVTLYCGANVSNLPTYHIGTVEYSGRGNADVVTARLNHDGSVRWSRNDGADSYEVPNAVAVLGNGHIAVSGYFGGRTRFGTESITNTPSGNYGFVQLLSSEGNHQWVCAAAPVTAGAPASTATSLGFTSVEDSTFAVVLDGSTFLWNGEQYSANGMMHVLMSTSKRTIDTVGRTSCTRDWFWSASRSTTLGAASPLYCPDATNDVLHVRTSPYAAELPVGRATQSLFVNSVEQDDAVAIVAGQLEGTLDLFDTPVSPDISNTFSSDFEGFVAAFNSNGDALYGLSIGSNDGSGRVYHATPTPGGFIALAQSDALLHLTSPPISTSANDLVVLAFGPPITSVVVTEFAVAGAEFEYGQWGTVFILTGEQVYQGELHRDVLGNLNPGTYFVQSGGRLSLCHVLSPHNIAFAVSTSAPRKGP